MVKKNYYYLLIYLFPLEIVASYYGTLSGNVRAKLILNQTVTKLPHNPHLHISLTHLLSLALCSVFLFYISLCFSFSQLLF